MVSFKHAGWPLSAVEEPAIIYVYAVSHLYNHMHERNATEKIRMQQFYLI